jgi:hypothetical protein
MDDVDYFVVMVYDNQYYFDTHHRPSRPLVPRGMESHLLRTGLLRGPCPG